MLLEPAWDQEVTGEQRTATEAQGLGSRLGWGHKQPPRGCAVGGHQALPWELGAGMMKLPGPARTWKDAQAVASMSGPWSS